MKMIQHTMLQKNTEGKLTLFPNYIPHFTTEHRSYSYRITLAFELKLIK